MGHGCVKKRPSGAKKLICHLLLPYLFLRRFCLRYRVLWKISRCLQLEKGSPFTRRPAGSRNFAKQQGYSLKFKLAAIFHLQSDVIWQTRACYQLFSFRVDHAHTSGCVNLAAGRKGQNAKKSVTALTMMVPWWTEVVRHFASSSLKKALHNSTISSIITRKRATSDEFVCRCKVSISWPRIVEFSPALR